MDCKVTLIDICVSVAIAFSTFAENDIVIVK
jgi:hypothetical protein